MCPPKGASSAQKEAQRLESQRLALEKRREQDKTLDQKTDRLDDRNRQSAARTFSIAMRQSFAPQGGARSLYTRTGGS